MLNDTRAQTTIDFVTGVSLFLVVVIFVFLFVPDLLEPFSSGTQEETVAVNRVADEISLRMLGSPENPYVLNATCTAKLFDNDPPGACRYDGTSAREQFNLEDRQSVNVTITAAGRIDPRNGEHVLCWNDDSSSLVNLSASACTPTSDDVPLQTGPPIRQGSSSSVSARRVVQLDNRTVSVQVVMW